MEPQWFIQDRNGVLHYVTVDDIVLDLVSQENTKIKGFTGSLIDVCHGKRTVDQLQYINFKRDRTDMSKWAILPTRSGNAATVRETTIVFDIVANHDAKVKEIKTDEQGNDIFIVDNNVENGIRTKNDLLAAENPTYPGFSAIAKKRKNGQIVKLQQGSQVIDLLTGTEKTIKKVCAQYLCTSTMIILDDDSIRQPWEIRPTEEEETYNNIKKKSILDKLYKFLHGVNPYERLLY